MTDTVDNRSSSIMPRRSSEAALAAGADAADAVVVSSMSMGVDVRLGKVEETERAESDDFALRVFVGRKTASVSANTIAERTALAERAVATARAAPEEPFARLADPDRLAADWEDLDMLDPVQPEIGRLTDKALAAEEAALAVEGITNSSGASAGWRLGGLVLATSHGFVGAHQSSHHSISTAVIAGEGTAMEQDYDYCLRVHAEDLDAPDQIGRNAGEWAVRRLNPTKLPSGTGTIVFDPRVSGGLIGHLAGAINGAGIARGTSFLKDSLNQQVFSSGIVISDDPHRPRGLGSRPFDGEGVD